jgi:hypothetical protein
VSMHTTQCLLTAIFSRPCSDRNGPYKGLNFVRTVCSGLLTRLSPIPASMPLLHGLLLYREDGDITFLRYIQNYTSHPQ